MSLRLVGVVALAGLTAVVAYILRFRKKEEETVDEPIEETLQRQEQDETEEDIKHVAFCVILEETNIGIEGTQINPEPAVGNKSIEAVEDTTSKTESLMEGIDRQLNEAESKNRNATPDPGTIISETQTANHATQEENLKRNVTDNSDTDRKEEAITNILDAPQSALEESLHSDPNQDEEKVVKQNDDSIETIEFETESAAIKEETILNNAQQPMESLEIIEPNQTNSDGIEKYILEEDQSIEIAEIKIGAQETTEEQVINEKGEQGSIHQLTLHADAQSESLTNPKECMVDFETIKSEEIINHQQQHANDDNDISSIELISLSEFETNSNKVSEEDIQINKEEELENSIQVPTNETEEHIQEDLDLSETNKLSNNTNSEVLHETNNIESDTSEEIGDLQLTTTKANNSSSLELISFDTISNKVSEEGTNDSKEVEQVPTAETEAQIQADLDLNETNTLSDNKINEGSLKTNDLAKIDESTETDIAKNADAGIASFKDPESRKSSNIEVEGSDAEIQLLKETNDKNYSNIIDDSDFSNSESDESSVESANTEITVDGAKIENEVVQEINGKSDDSKNELNDSIGLMLRPSWQIKKPQKTLNQLDVKLTSI
eukprot:GFUD01017150.1.p1 GENE.GFUD01017150.1~~GFUD01017150.1.p1  ORF type:complete len:610 (+),score=177.51 GFUD01017150.1:231-2060(+)